MPVLTEIEKVSEWVIRWYIGINLPYFEVHYALRDDVISSMVAWPFDIFLIAYYATKSS